LKFLLKRDSKAHKAAVADDTIGNPFKDTAGASLHVLIKLLSRITPVLAPFLSKDKKLSTDKLR
jgi:K(+)-stimulated pyrophosphate-energized sodium pump